VCTTPELTHLCTTHDQWSWLHASLCRQGCSMCPGSSLQLQLWGRTHYIISVCVWGGLLVSPAHASVTCGPVTVAPPGTVHAACACGCDAVDHIQRVRPEAEPLATPIMACDALGRMCCCNAVHCTAGAAQHLRAATTTTTSSCCLRLLAFHELCVRCHVHHITQWLASPLWVTCGDLGARCYLRVVLSHCKAGMDPRAGGWLHVNVERC
jgi:hypothetical protein